MPERIEFNMLGVEALDKKFKAITYDVKRKGGRSSLRKAAKLIATKAKSKAERVDNPQTARSIAKNIAIRWNNKIFKRTGDLAFKIGVAGGAKFKKGDQGEATPHWRFVEFGTSKMAAQPFMRPSLSENIGAATAKFLVEYEKAIDRAIKKAAKGVK
jgi:HK97 gp10 family phage protein